VVLVTHLQSQDQLFPEAAAVAAAVEVAATAVPAVLVAAELVATHR